MFYMRLKQSQIYVVFHAWKKIVKSTSFVKYFAIYN